MKKYVRFLWNCNGIKKGDILEFNQYMKSDKILYIIHLDIEYLIKKIGSDNPENFQNRKLESLFRVDIQCKIYGYLIT